MINKKYMICKKAIRKNLYADAFTLSMYSFSPYHACEHGCIYCDGRADKYYVEGEFDKDIVIRQNLPKLLEVELPKLRENAPISIGSGVTDVYQPVEREEKLMRNCLEILGRYNYPVHLLTKSPIVLRDLDLFKQLHSKGGFTLFISLTFSEDEVRKIFEPKTGSVRERLETIRFFKKNGLRVGVLLMPLLPWISDTEKNITKLLVELKELEVDFIIPGSLTLRPGRQKELYFQIIEDFYPLLLEPYQELYKKNLVSGNPSYRYRKEFYKRIPLLLSGFNPLVPHSLFRNKMPVYNEVLILLSHMVELYSMKEVNVDRLKKSLSSYTVWVEREKKRFNRRRSLTADYIDEKLRSFIALGEFDNLIQNEKLESFLIKVINERYVFNYCTMELEKPDLISQPKSYLKQ
jgi:DNA repair photolyase